MSQHACRGEKKTAGKAHPPWRRRNPSITLHLLASAKPILSKTALGSIFARLATVHHPMPPPTQPRNLRP